MIGNAVFVNDNIIENEALIFHNNILKGQVIVMKKIIIIKEAAAITTCTVSFGYIMFQVFNWLMYV